MKRSTLRMLIATILLIGNLSIGGMILVLTSKGGFRQEEGKILLLITVPLTVPNMLMAIKYYFDRWDADQNGAKRASGGSILFGLALPILFLALLAAMIYGKAHNWVVTEFDSVESYVAALEAMLGGSLAMIVKTMFPGTGGGE